MKKMSLGVKFDNKLFKNAAVLCVMHIFLEKGHFEKLNCEIKFMGTFNTAKKSVF